MTGSCAQPATSKCRHSFSSIKWLSKFWKTLLTSYDIDMVMKTRKTYEKNPIIEYLNINSLRTKILNLKEILHKAPIDILFIYKTKLDETFPDAEFMIENYQFPSFRRNKNKKGVGKIVFIRKELLAKKLEKLWN